MESAQGWSIPLDRCKDGKKVYYRYSDLKFSINNQPVNATEINQLKSALAMLTRFKGLPQFEWMNEMLLKFDQTLHLTTENREIVGFDHNEFLRGIEHISDLFNAISYNKILMVLYKPFQAETASEYLIHPRYIKQYNGRWFLMATSPGITRITVMPLDRIEGITETGESFIPDKNLDFKEYFDDIVGVSRNEGAEVEKVEIFITKELVPYILTKPLHGSQKRVSQNEAGMVISLSVIPNYELEQLILSHGEKVQVLTPQDLQEKIFNRLKAGALQYAPTNQ
jgi:predicted DNA-binding transcriptional regulator YafY